MPRLCFSTSPVSWRRCRGAVPAPVMESQEAQVARRNRSCCTASWRGLALLAAGVALLAVGVSACTGGPVEVKTPTGTSGLPTMPRPTGIPWLTQEQRDDAVRLVDADLRFQKLFGGHSYTVADLGPWHTSDLFLIGAGMVIVFDEPISLGQTDWPNVSHNDPDAWYSTGIMRASVTGLTKVQVRVDLRRHAVVEIYPDE